MRRYERILIAFLLEWGHFCPKFQVQGVAFHQPFFMTETRIIVLSYDIKCGQKFLLSQFTFFDRRTDRQTFFLWLTPPCIICSVVKIKANVVVFPSSFRTDLTNFMTISGLNYSALFSYSSFLFESCDRLS